MNNEADVFSTLADLCQSPGYVHALAALCFRDNIVRYSGKMEPSDLQRHFSPKRLIRTELSTLIGLMIQGEMDWTMPPQRVVAEHIGRTDDLLNMLHETLRRPMLEAVTNQNLVATKGRDILKTGELLREAIFYGGESAYRFQYRDFAPLKYANDDAWLIENKGFSIFNARIVADSVSRLQERKLRTTIDRMATLPADKRMILPAYTFSAREVAEISGLEEQIVEPVLNAFAMKPGQKNETFRALNDFNVANATPLLRFNGEFVLLQSYSLFEALYESPFYWIMGDKKYESTASRHRGRFTETFCRDRLEMVFGKARVHTNLDIFESKAKKVGEIDVLVLFGDRALIVQAKSKRLTLESRKGNDGHIRDDFQKSIQDSYEQGLTCAERLTDPNITITDVDGREIRAPKQLSEIYILCVVADHYPALHFQTQQFIKYKQTDIIHPPMVLDVFAFDAITEMLTSPLYLLSYINRRVRYMERLMATHEMVILGYHIKRSLWIDDHISMLHLDDDVSTELDVAMAVRRDGVPGQETPDGFLTRLSSTTVGRIIKAIEASPDSGSIDLGYLLLSMSEDAAVKASAGIDQATERARRDGETHDISLGFDAPQCGFTLHCSAEPVLPAESRLRTHCKLRKYRDKARTWFGICIHPIDQSLRFAFKLDYEWQQDSELDRLAEDAHLPPKLLGGRTMSADVGRNDPCPCDSGRKYKKCHGR